MYAPPSALLGWRVIWKFWKIFSDEYRDCIVCGSWWIIIFENIIYIYNILCIYWHILAIFGFHLDEKNNAHSNAVASFCSLRHVALDAMAESKGLVPLADHIKVEVSNGVKLITHPLKVKISESW